MTKCRVIKYVLISCVGQTIVMIMAMASGAFLSNKLFFVSLVLFVLVQWWAGGQDYKRGFERGTKLAGLAHDKIDACFEQREREMLLKIQQDLKDRGIKVDLVGENGLIKKKRKYYA